MKNTILFLLAIFLLVFSCTEEGLQKGKKYMDFDEGPEGASIQFHEAGEHKLLLEEPFRHYSKDSLPYLLLMDIPAEGEGGKLIQFHDEKKDNAAEFPFEPKPEK